MYVKHAIKRIAVTLNSIMLVVEMSCVYTFWVRSLDTFPEKINTRVLLVIIQFFLSKTKMFYTLIRLNMFFSTHIKYYNF